MNKTKKPISFFQAIENCKSEKANPLEYRNGDGRPLLLVALGSNHNEVIAWLHGIIKNTEKDELLAVKDGAGHGMLHMAVNNNAVIHFKFLFEQVFNNDWKAVFQQKDDNGLDPVSCWLFHSACQNSETNTYLQELEFDERTQIALYVLESNETPELFAKLAQKLFSVQDLNEELWEKIQDKVLLGDTIAAGVYSNQQQTYLKTLKKRYQTALLSITEKVSESHPGYQAYSTAFDELKKLLINIQNKFKVLAAFSEDKVTEYLNEFGKFGVEIEDESDENQYRYLEQAINVSKLSPTISDLGDDKKYVKLAEEINSSIASFQPILEEMGLAVEMGCNLYKEQIELKAAEFNTAKQPVFAMIEACRGLLSSSKQDTSGLDEIKSELQQVEAEFNTFNDTAKSNQRPSDALQALQQFLEQLEEVGARAQKIYMAEVNEANELLKEIISKRDLVKQLYANNECIRKMLHIQEGEQANLRLQLINRLLTNYNEVKLLDGTEEPFLSVEKMNGYTELRDEFIRYYDLYEKYSTISALTQERDLRVFDYGFDSENSEKNLEKLKDRSQLGTLLFLIKNDMPDEQIDWFLENETLAKHFSQRFVCSEHHLVGRTLIVRELKKYTADKDAFVRITNAVSVIIKDNELTNPFIILAILLTSGLAEALSSVSQDSSDDLVSLLKIILCRDSFLQKSECKVDSDFLNIRGDLADTGVGHRAQVYAGPHSSKLSLIQLLVDPAPTSEQLVKRAAIVKKLTDWADTYKGKPEIFQQVEAFVMEQALPIVLGEQALEKVSEQLSQSAYHAFSHRHGWERILADFVSGVLLGLPWLGRKLYGCKSALWYAAGTTRSENFGQLVESEEVQAIIASAAA